MIAVTVQTDIERFSGTLSRYMALTKKLPADVIAAKARDITIKLYEEYALHKFGGPGKKPKGLARAELDTRSASGKGIKVRQELIDHYKSERAKMNFATRSIGQRLRKARSGGTLSNWSDLHEERKAARRIRSNMWRSIVEGELFRRQQGIGALGASFLLFRKRNSQARGTYLVKNKTGKPMGSAVIDQHGMLIEGFTDGLRLVSDRYGILPKALQASSADMQIYIDRKEREARGALK